MTTPAGWYPDPGSGPGALRWWDGEQWTAHVDLRALPAPPPGPADLLEKEAGVARLARIAALVSAVASPLQVALGALAISALADAVRDGFFDPDRAGRSTFGPNPLVSAGSNLVGLVVFAVFVITLVWVHGSARTAEQLGVPARRTPGWAVGGFLVPVLNLWWPYQSVCDLFPPGHAARRTVGRWWALYLCGWVLSLAAYALVFVSGAAVVAALVPAAALQVGAALSLRQVIGSAASVHRELVSATS